MRNHDQLIDELSHAVRPVKRTWPTGWRVAAWVVAVLPCGMLTSWAWHSRFTDWSQPGSWLALVTLLLSLGIGAGAMAAALTLSIAGRQAVRLPWMLLPGAIWLAINLLNTRAASAAEGAGHWGEGIHCYLFMLMASLPMIVISLACLYRTRSLQPGKCLALAGAGVAFMSSMLLSLCHEVHLHRLDFTMHLAAGVTIVMLTVLAGRRWIRLSR